MLDDVSAASNSNFTNATTPVTLISTEIFAGTVTPTTGSGKLTHCDADSLTDFYGLVVQGILAFLAFASLIVKRLLEPVKTRRPWVVWFFDTSKQATGAGFVHILNVFLAPLLSHQDPCTWYVVSFMLDSSFGLLFIFVCVKLVGCIARIKGYKTLKFGEYGNPPSCRPWFHQCVVFVLITLLMKVVVTLVMQFHFWQQVRRVILSPITNPKVEVTLVMLVIPFVMNTFMFWFTSLIVVVTLVMQFHFWQQVRRVILSPITNPKVEVTLVMLVIPFVMNTFMFWAVDTFTMQKQGYGGVAPGARNHPIDDGADEKLLSASAQYDLDLDDDPFYHSSRLRVS